MILTTDMKQKLNEIWLCEMAIQRKQFVEQAESLSYSLIMHIGKCYLFKNSEYYEHWLKECGNFCMKFDDIKLKPNAKRPEKELFLSTILDEIETAQDSKFFLEGALSKCPELEGEDISNDDAFTFLDVYNNMREELADYMSNEDTFDKYTYMNVIDKYIKNN